MLAVAAGSSTVGTALFPSNQFNCCVAAGETCGGKVWLSDWLPREIATLKWEEQFNGQEEEAAPEKEAKKGEEEEEVNREPLERISISTYSERRTRRTKRIQKRNSG